MMDHRPWFAPLSGTAAPSKRQHDVGIAAILEASSCREPEPPAREQPLLLREQSATRVILLRPWLLTVPVLLLQWDPCSGTADTEPKSSFKLQREKPPAVEAAPIRQGRGVSLKPQS